MKPIVKKSISIVIILALIAGAIFLAVKWLFPVPSNMQVYNITTELNEDEEFNSLQANLEDFVTKSLAHSMEANYNMKTNQQLTAIYINLHTIKLLTNFYAPSLALAKNTNIYNKNAAAAKTNYADLKKAVKAANTHYVDHIQEYMSSLLPKSINIINDYSLALSGLVTTAFEKAAELNSNLSEIYKNLEPDFQTNALSIKLVQIADKWLEVQRDFLSDNEMSFETLWLNSNAFYAYVLARINQTVSLSYNANLTETQNIIDASAKANMGEALKNYGTVSEEAYLATIENEEIKTATQNLFVLIKGE